MAALEHEADVAVDADGASDTFLHLPVAALQLLHQLARRAGGGGGARHLRAVCGVRDRCELRGRLGEWGSGELQAGNGGRGWGRGVTWDGV